MTRAPTPTSNEALRKEALRESSDVPWRPLVMGVGSLAVVVLFTLAVDRLLLKTLSRERVPGARLSHRLAAERQTPPEPRLDGDPQEFLRERQRIEVARVTEYRWIDRESGVVAIPIERAMALLEQEGLPVVSESTKKGR